MKHTIFKIRWAAAAVVMMALGVTGSLASGQTKLGAQAFMNQVFGQRASSLEIDARMGEWNRMPARWQKCVDERYACSLNGGCLREVAADDRHYYTVTVPAYAISETAASNHQYSLRFRIPNENLRVRMAYAMEFLRSRCDQMAATGF